MKPKLLLIDDDQPVRESLRKLLETEGYDVHPARDGVEAIESFKNNQFDLVVLDINLGADNGWTVFETMVVMNPFVPTIVITGEWGQREKAVTFGVEGLIEKPIDVPVLLQMIRGLLAETAEDTLKRICGNIEYCRFVPRHYEPYLRMLQARYAAPYRMTSDGIAGAAKRPSTVGAVVATDDDPMKGTVHEEAEPPNETDLHEPVGGQLP